jgi:hypothetical protein
LRVVASARRLVAAKVSAQRFRAARVGSQGSFSIGVLIAVAPYNFDHRTRKSEGDVMT